MIISTGLYISGDYVSTAGGYAQFSCTASSGTAATGIQWLVNGSEMNSNSTHVVILHNQFLTRLELMNIPVEFNTTIIQCAYEMATSRVAMLLLQGQYKMQMQSKSQYPD